MNHHPGPRDKHLGLEGIGGQESLGKLGIWHDVQGQKTAINEKLHLMWVVGEDLNAGHS